MPVAVVSTFSIIIPIHEPFLRSNSYYYFRFSTRLHTILVLYTMCRRQTLLFRTIYKLQQMVARSSYRILKPIQLHTTQNRLLLRQTQVLYRLCRSDCKMTVTNRSSGLICYSLSIRLKEDIILHFKSMVNQPQRFPVYRSVHLCKVFMEQTCLIRRVLHIVIKLCLVHRKYLPF